MRCGKWIDFIIQFNDFKGVYGVVFIAFQGAQRSKTLHSCARTAVVVADGVLQDALEQQRQFGGWLVAVLFRQPHHAVLDDIECRVIVAHGEKRLFEGAALDVGKKFGKLGAGSQGDAYSI